MLQRIGKSLWHPNLHLLFYYHPMLGELVTSIASLIKSCTRKYCRTLLAKDVLVSLVGTLSWKTRKKVLTLRFGF